MPWREGLCAHAATARLRGPAGIAAAGLARRPADPVQVRSGRSGRPRREYWQCGSMSIRKARS